MRFLHPWMLLLVPLAIFAAIAAFWLQTRRERRLSLLANASVLAAISGDGRTVFGQTIRLRIVLLAAGFVLAAIAAARPQWGRSDFQVSSRGASLLVALDVSRSMLATDVRPNRLERAKVDILDLIADLKGDRAGLLVFRGKGVMLCPITADYAFLRQAIDSVSVDSAPRGETDIADALDKALEALASSSEDNCAIVLISDGEDLAGRAKAAAQKAASRNIPIFTVGIGDPAGADVPDPDGGGAMKFGGQKVRSRLTESTLKEIATVSGGAYIPLATAGTAGTTLGAIYRQHLSRLAKREFDEMLENRFVERYRLFLVPAILLLLAAAALSTGRLAPSRRILAAILCLLAFSSFASPSITSPTNSPTPPLTNSSTPPLTNSPNISPRALYNQAVELYAAGDYTNAAALLLPLSLRRDFPEAVELYAAAEFASASTNAAERLASLSASASAFQLAAGEDGRSPSEDGRTAFGQSSSRRSRNLARAVAAIAPLRNQIRAEEIEAKYGKTPPPQLLARMMEAQRSISSKAREAASIPDAAKKIAAFEELAASQSEIADMDTVIAKVLEEAAKGITNEESRVALEALVSETGKMVASATEALENIDTDSAAATSDKAAILFLESWKPMAEPPAFVQESILCETNTVDHPAEPRWRLVPDAAVSLDLMNIFAQTFPAWAEEYIKNQAQAAAQSGETNAPAFTEENVAKINELMEPLMFILEDSAKFDGDAKQKTEAAREALPILEQIRDLLPKPPQQQNQQNQDQQQDQNQDQQQQQQPQDQPQEQDQQQEQQKQQEQKQEETPQDVQEALRRAIQREREHEAEKQKLRREAPLPPNARDW